MAEQAPMMHESDTAEIVHDEVATATATPVEPEPVAAAEPRVELEPLAEVTPLLRKRVEALLFATNAPLDAMDLAESLGDVPLLSIQAAIQELIDDYDGRDTAIGLARAVKGKNPAYYMDVKREFRTDLLELLPPTLDPRTVETLVLIALNQPVSQARLVHELGSRVYDDVRSLSGQGLIQKIRRRNSYSLRTTTLFAAQFGFEDDPAEIKKEIADWAEREGINVERIGGKMRKKRAEKEAKAAVNAPVDDGDTETVDATERGVVEAAAEIDVEASEPEVVAETEATASAETETEPPTAVDESDADTVIEGDVERAEVEAEPKVDSESEIVDEPEDEPEDDDEDVSS